MMSSVHPGTIRASSLRRLATAAVTVAAAVTVVTGVPGATPRTTGHSESPSEHNELLAAPITAHASLAPLAQDPPGAPVNDISLNPPGQSSTDIEPDSYAYASAPGNPATIVTTWATGFVGKEKPNIAAATSFDDGKTWQTNYLPGITQANRGDYKYAGDNSVAYDAMHQVWLVSSLPIRATGEVPTILVSRSADGIHWARPRRVFSQTGDSYDKEWVTCDNHLQSPYLGHCYLEVDDNTLGNAVEMATSTDGGVTWSHLTSPRDHFDGLGGEPVVQPDGNVVVPITNLTGGFEPEQIAAFSSHDGGKTWGAHNVVATVSQGTSLGGLRIPALPSVAIDGAGTIYVAWEDCRFEKGCGANDIVMTSSADGVTWTPVSRVAIGATGSGIDAFLPGIGVDTNTSGAAAHIGIVYYYNSNEPTGCSTKPDHCRLRVGFIESLDGGTTWGAPIELAGPMRPTWLYDSWDGYMVGDYFSTSFGADGTAHPVFAAARTPLHGGEPQLNMYTASIPAPTPPPSQTTGRGLG